MTQLGRHGPSGVVRLTVGDQLLVVTPNNTRRHGTASSTDAPTTAADEMSKPTASWERVGDRFYRKVQLYTSIFDQDLELENYVLAGAPLSGAVGGQSQCTPQQSP